MFLFRKRSTVATLSRILGITTVIFIFASASRVQAGIFTDGGLGQAIENMFINLLYLLIAGLGAIFNGLMYLLIQISVYNSFGGEYIVEIGWTVLRDVSNMFFIFVLLVIAISTIVKWQVLTYRQTLRRLIIMALLINFSRTITVFFIDLSQVILLTFISAVTEAISGGPLVLLGLDRLVNFSLTNTTVIDPSNPGGGVDFTTMLVGVIFMIIATIVAAAYVLMFLVRIVTLWFLIIFSPLAFFASTLPQAKRWYDQWWSMFSSNLIIGPILAFMLWLVLTITANYPTPTLVGAGQSGDPSFVHSIAASTAMRYLVGILLLIYSLRLAGTIGAVGGNIGSKIAGQMSSYVSTAAKKTGDYLKWGKSGQGGILGRAKSGALAATEGAAGAFSRVPLMSWPAGALSRAAGIARTRQTETRTKAEAAYLAGLKDPAQRRAAENQTFAGISVVSAPRRKAAIERDLADRLTAKDEQGNFVMANEEIGEQRRRYQRSGATAQELREFDKKTGLRGLRNNNNQFTDAASGQRAQEIMLEMLPQGLSGDIIRANPNEAANLLARNKTTGQLTAEYEKLGPQERQQFMDGIAAAHHQARQEMAAAAPGSDQYLAAERRANTISNAAVNMNAQRALDSLADPSPFNHLVTNFNQAVSRMNESAHSSIQAAWLRDPANHQQIVDPVNGLSASNLRRLMVSQNLNDESKDSLYRIIIDAHNGGNTRLTEALESSEVTRGNLHDYEARTNHRRAQQQPNPQPGPQPNPQPGPQPNPGGGGRRGRRNRGGGGRGGGGGQGGQPAPQPGPQPGPQQPAPPQPAPQPGPQAAPGGGPPPGPI